MLTMTVVTAPPEQEPSPMTGMMRSDCLVSVLSEQDVVQKAGRQAYAGTGSGGKSSKEGVSDTRVWSWEMAEPTPEAMVELFIADNHP